MATTPTYRSLGFASYSEYLRSSHWRDIQTRYRESDLPQNCYCCGDGESVHLHHKTYERIGAEDLTDLVPLCPRCHALVHVLERRGDIGIDLAGLLDEARGAAHRAREEERKAAAKAVRHAERDRARAQPLHVRLEVALREAERLGLPTNRFERRIEHVLESLERRLGRNRIRG
jgi:hypothetical protein